MKHGRALDRLDSLQVAALDLLWSGVIFITILQYHNHLRFYARYKPDRSSQPAQKTTDGLEASKGPVVFNTAFYLSCRLIYFTFIYNMLDTRFDFTDWKSLDGGRTGEECGLGIILI